MERNRRLRDLYEDVNGKIPKGYELHHKIPIHAGGTDNENNLICLDKECHAQTHLELYKKYNNFRDLCAYYMIGYNFTKAHEISSSEGGKIGGKVTYEKGVGIFRDDNERVKWASMGGSASQETLKREHKSAFYDPKLRHDISSKGGKNGRFSKEYLKRQGIENPDEFLRMEQSNRGKKGGRGNKGFVWINDGMKSHKYTKKQQEIKSLEDYIKDNPQYKRGRI